MNCLSELNWNVNKIKIIHWIKGLQLRRTLFRLYKKPDPGVGEGIEEIIHAGTMPLILFCVYWSQTVKYARTLFYMNHILWGAQIQISAFQNCEYFKCVDCDWAMKGIGPVEVAAQWKWRAGTTPREHFIAGESLLILSFLLPPAFVGNWWLLISLYH